MNFVIDWKFTNHMKLIIVVIIFIPQELDNRRHDFQTTRTGKSSSPFSNHLKWKSSSPFSNHKNWKIVVTIFKPPEMKIVVTIFKPQELENHRHHFHTTRTGRSSSIFKLQELGNCRHHFQTTWNENRHHHFQTTRTGKSASPFSNHKNWKIVFTIFKPQEVDNHRYHFQTTRTGQSSSSFLLLTTLICDSDHSLFLRGSSPTL